MLHFIHFVHRIRQVCLQSWRNSFIELDEFVFRVGDICPLNRKKVKQVKQMNDEKKSISSRHNFRREDLSSIMNEMNQV